MVKDPEGEPDLAGFKNKGMCQEHADETFKRSTGHFTINEFLRYVIKDPNIWLMLDKQQGFSDEHIVLSENNTPIAELIPISQRVAGLHAGGIWTSDDFDEPLPEQFWAGDK